MSRCASAGLRRGRLRRLSLPERLHCGQRLANRLHPRSAVQYFHAGEPRRFGRTAGRNSTSQIPRGENLSAFGIPAALLRSPFRGRAAEHSGGDAQGREQKFTKQTKREISITAAHQTWLASGTRGRLGVGRCQKSIHPLLFRAASREIAGVRTLGLGSENGNNQWSRCQVLQLISDPVQSLGSAGSRPKSETESDAETGW